MTLATKSDQETRKIGLRIGKRLAKNFSKNRLSPVLCLYGELGTGKTTFVRGLAKGLGIASRITSPTFTYQRVHFGKIKLYHFDCYRLSNRPSPAKRDEANQLLPRRHVGATFPDELLMHDLHEAVENRDGIIAIEWSEKIKHHLPEKHIDIYFEYVDENIRKIKILYL